MVSSPAAAGGMGDGKRPDRMPPRCAETVSFCEGQYRSRMFRADFQTEKAR
jgi:hypothetical protein